MLYAILNVKNMIIIILINLDIFECDVFGYMCWGMSVSNGNVIRELVWTGDGSWQQSDPDHRGERPRNTAVFQAVTPNSPHRRLFARNSLCDSTAVALIPHCSTSWVQRGLSTKPCQVGHRRVIDRSID